MSNQNGSNGSAPAELARVLTLRSLVFYGIAFIIPLAFFTTYGIVTNTTHGHVSMTYVVATLCMVFTAYSYCRMSKAFPSSGSVYAYATETFNPYIGVYCGMDNRAGIYVPANVELSGIRYFYAGCTSEHTSLGMGCTFYSDCNWCKPVGNQSCRYFQQCCCYHSIDFLSSIIDYDRSLYHRS